MNIKNLLKSMFTYTPIEPYNFNLIENENPNNKTNENPPESEGLKKISPNISTNLDYMKIKYNLLINSDVIIREFTLNAKGNQYCAFLIYIDGMVDSELMDKFILEPLMLRNKNNSSAVPKKVISESTKNNVTIRKIKKLNLADYLMNCLIPQNTIKQVSEFKKAISGINSGNCALFVDTLNIAFDIEVKGFKQRNIDTPNNEIVIKGPHEAFVENIRTNTSLLRRFINNENLIIENIEIGQITQTKCVLCYMKDITNNDLIAEVRFRLNNLSIDSLLSAGQLEQLIVDSNDLSIPQVLSTERPDKAISYLLDGKVIIIVNGTPYALIVPTIIEDFLSSPDDKNLKTTFSNFLKGLRFFAAFITLLLPGLYVAITSFHQEILPTELLFSILASRENVPFPVIVEIIVMELSFELIREAGLRVPTPIGPTIGIVGALVLGQAAVSAGIVSPILIIIVAITGISSFTIPDFSFGFHLRICRFAFIFLGYTAGFLGIALGLFVYISLLCDTTSFGVPYTTALSPISGGKGTSFLLPPIWKREYRASYLNTKRPKKQNHISMGWKYK